MRSISPFEEEKSICPPAYDIPEILQINCRQSEIQKPRLNLLVPALSLKFTFGGINTALDFFSSLTVTDEDVRIIITDEVESDFNGLPGKEDWIIKSSEEPDLNGKVIICFGDRYNKDIPIREKDLFVATAWWTAYNGNLIKQWQENVWPSTPRPLIYLIQDFEPAFYKWSSRYSLALSTYFVPNTIPVVNTKLLFDFLAIQGITFDRYYIFEPSINKTLSDALPLDKGIKKQKRLLFYGRPSVERNAFELLVKGIELWSWWYPNAKEWELVSLGEAYDPIKFGNGISIQVQGKVTLQEYKDLLKSSAIGASLMVSPHPSYPPLEMAAFQMGVVTNSFANKNLSDLHSNILSLDLLTPESIAKALMAMCEKFEGDPHYFANGEFKRGYFLNKKDIFSFVCELKEVFFP